MAVIHPLPARAFPILEFIMGDSLQAIHPDGAA